jgi:NAD(P)-dependent dehydrogenase (short-subunit alcohol dehydrogenase family)
MTVLRKVAFVTGGTGGLGLAIVKRLLDMGYEVISVSRNENQIQRVKQELNSKNLLLFQGDITKEETLEQIYQYLLKEYGYINVIVNNAGIMAGGGVEDITPQQWDRVFELNVHAPFRIVKKLLCLLKHGEATSVINISSIASRITGGCIAYSASKAAVDMMTKSMAKELAEYYIRVNSVNPGLINTGFQVKNQVVEDFEYEKFLEKTGLDYPLGVGTAEDVAELVCYLISDHGRWITGSNFVIDGGRLVNL